TRVRGRQVHRGPPFVVGAREFGELPVEVVLACHRPGDGGFAVGVTARRAPARPDRAEVLLDLVVDDGVDRPQVAGDVADLLRDTTQEVKVRRVRRTVTLRLEVVDLGDLRLAVAVDPADALLETRRVEGDVEVHQAMAVVLEVDSLPRGVR